MLLLGSLSLLFAPACSLQSTTLRHGKVVLLRPCSAPRCLPIIRHGHRHTPAMASGKGEGMDSSSVTGGGAVSGERRNSGGQGRWLSAGGAGRRQALSARCNRKGVVMAGEAEQVYGADDDGEGDPGIELDDERMYAVGGGCGCCTVTRGTHHMRFHAILVSDLQHDEVAGHGHPPPPLLFPLYPTPPPYLPFPLYPNWLNR